MLLGGLCLVGCESEMESTATPPKAVATADAALGDGDAAAAGESGAILDVISNPADERMNRTAPDKYEVLFNTSAGDFVIRVTRDWAPLGADRFYSLVVNKFYDQCRFFRVAPGRNGQRFVAQWGIHGEAAVNNAWQRSPAARIEDDPVAQSNTRGRVTFATSGPNSRTTQLFISYADNSFLDAMGFSAFGEVIGEGMVTLEAINDEYAERPDQRRIQFEGNAYLKKSFPNLDYIISAKLVEGSSGG